MPEIKITGCHELNDKAIHTGKKRKEKKRLPGICQQLSSSQKAKVKNDQYVCQKLLGERLQSPSSSGFKSHKEKNCPKLEEMLQNNLSPKPYC